MDDLTTMLERVCDQATFLQFVKALVEDRRASVRNERQTPSSPYGPDAGGWENVTIEDYLESAAAWAEDIGLGASSGLPERPTWRAFASFLYAGKSYE